MKNHHTHTHNNATHNYISKTNHTSTYILPDLCKILRSTHQMQYCKLLFTESLAFFVFKSYFHFKREEEGKKQILL